MFENQEHFKTRDELHTAIKFAIGHTAKVQTRSGVHEYPLPTDFATMGQDKFRAYFDRAMDFIVAEVIPGLDCKDLMQEVEDMVA